MHPFRGGGGGAEVGVVRLAEPRCRGLGDSELHPVRTSQLGKLRLHVLPDQLLDAVRVHVWHGPYAELANDPCRDHRLRADAVEGALDAVQRQRGVAPPVHQHVLFRAVQQGVVHLVHPGVPFPRLQIEIHLLVAQALFLGDRGDVVQDAGDQDPPLGVHEAGHDLHEVGHALVHGASDHPGVHVLGGARHLQVKVDVAAEAVDQARLGLAGPVRVRNADVVHGLRV
mmetsp:Transcript_97572/g.298160  ORF Transcript_97572/g.298160 Transcript_97572/m.298160 type:complete len:227 (+) Transcript_97572:452-1132(+)